MEIQSQTIFIAIMIAVFIFIFIKKKNNQKKVGQFMNKNAKIIDVRSKEEFSSASNPKSINIPLDEFEKSIGKFDKTEHIIVCCASGMRSAMALQILKKNGFVNALNAGPWTKTIY